MIPDHTTRSPGSGAVAVLATALIALILGPLLPTAAAGQDRQAAAPPVSAGGDTVRVVPGPHYEASDFRRKLFGHGWREVWLTPVDVQVFDFDSYGGGVEWTKRGGGNQSMTLHLEAEDDWREYIFRSVDKFPADQALPPDLEGTTVGRAVGDMISGLFPAAPLLVPPFLEAVDILHVEPVLRVMPDDPRLEVYQDTFAGMLGTVEIQPNEAPGDEPGYAGSSKIKGTEEFLNDIEESKTHRLDERELLAARLVDFLINDTDRTQDNMRWARWGQKGDYRWRVLPIDRDWAFIDARGWITGLARGAYPKLAEFGPDYPSIGQLAYGSHILDRRLLQRLTRDDYAEVAEVVRLAITDHVIDDAIARLPDRWQRETAAPERIREALRSRRDGLPAVAMDFYDFLATDVDIYGTDEDDQVVVRRMDDGRVRVTITWPDDSQRSGEIFYDRTFLPAETGELRVHLQGGDDLARVTGSRNGAIVVRVIGGGGDDRLEDEAGGGATHFYDARGDNELVRGRGTHVSTRAWDPPEPTEGLRAGVEWKPDWGGSRGWSPALGYGDVSGVVVGLGPTWTSYGFRRLPYHWQVDGRVLYATRDNSVGMEISGDYRYENSPLALTFAARAVPFHGFRFNGYGNDSPAVGAAGLVEQNRVEIMPALRLHIGWRDRAGTGLVTGPNSPGAEEAVEGALRPLVGTLDLGPTFLWTEPSPAAESPLATDRPLGAGSLSRAGVRTAVELDRTDRDAVPRNGWRGRAAIAGYPAVGGLSEGFAEASGEFTTYVPLLRAGPHLAFRAGGSRAMGAFPVQHSSFVGGRTTLRGYRWERFRGDAAAFGSAELRVPVMPVELLIRWELGLFGLADAGRVWLDGESPGGWHTGLGGGLWLTSMGRAVSAAYARGEEDRFYLQAALSF